MSTARQRKAAHEWKCFLKNSSCYRYKSWRREDNLYNSMKPVFTNDRFVLKKETFSKEDDSPSCWGPRGWSRSSSTLATANSERCDPRNCFSSEKRLPCRSCMMSGFCSCKTFICSCVFDGCARAHGFERLTSVKQLLEICQPYFVDELDDERTTLYRAIPELRHRHTTIDGDFYISKKGELAACFWIKHCNIMKIFTIVGRP